MLDNFSESYLKALLAQNILHVLICDENGYPVMFNQSYADMLKEYFGKEIKPGLSIEKRWERGLADWWQSNCRRALAGEVFCADFSHPCQGKIHNFSCYYHPIIDNDNIKGFIELTYDKTTKKTERDLEQSEEKYQKLIANLPVVTWTADENGKTIFVSPNVTQIDGYTVEEILAADPEEWFNRIHPEDRPIVINAFEQLFQEKRKFDIEYRMLTKDKKWIWWHDRAVSVYSKDGIKYVDGILEDITERKQLLQNLLDSEKFSVVGQLAAGVAHEFNNILAIHQMYFDSLQMELDDQEAKLSKNMVENLPNIQKTIERGKTIVSNLVSFAQPKKPNKEKCLIKEIINNALTLENKQFELDNISIVLDMLSKRRVRIDRGLIEQAFLNLLINAHQAIQAKEEVEGQVIIRAKDTKNAVEIKFEDNGIGMTKDICDNIFHPFFSTKGAYAKNDKGIEGTGLGLSIVHQIIKNHKGSIEVVSHEGKGSTFTIYIPFYTGTEKIGKNDIMPDEPIEKESKKTWNILVIDDETMILNMIKKILQAKGHKVQTANSGKKALEMFSQNTFDLVLLDLLLPNMNGKQIFQQLKKNDKNLKIIIMSGKLDNEYKEFQRDNCVILKKPFRLDELYKALEQAKNLT